MTEKIEWYREVLALEPNSKVFFPLAKMLAGEGDVQEAVKVLETGLERHSEYLEARLFLIELLYQTHQKDACAKQVNELSAMFASYAGFWQAWAACLAQEPEEEDTASILRFLAANFISGPLKLHDVLNRGLAAIIEEKRNEASRISHAHELSQNSQSEDSVSGQEVDHLPTELESQISGSIETAADPEDTTSTNGIAAEFYDADENNPGDDSISPDIETENVEEIAHRTFLAEPGETEALFPGVSTDEETRSGSEEEEIAAAREKEFLLNQNAASLKNDIAEESSRVAEDLPASEAILVDALSSEEKGSDLITENEIQEDNSPIQLQEEADIPEMTVKSEVAETDAEASEISVDPLLSLEDNVSGILAEAMNGETLESLTATETLESLDIPEVPDYQENLADNSIENGSYATEKNQSGEEAFESLIDRLADQSVELTANAAQAMDEHEQEPDNHDNKIMQTSSLQDGEEEELDEIFNENSAPGSIDSDQLKFAMENLENNDTEVFIPESDQDEKISLRTRSMAEVLAEQGDIQGALDIYHELQAAATDMHEIEDIKGRIATLQLKMPDQERSIDTPQDSSKLISLLESLAQRVEARVLN